ncbi:MAG: hypothetical protein JNL57_05925 [Bacteroidetes bacterium]|nr:hypothetical protein [Bacteroidota bacterium]
MKKDDIRGMIGVSSRRLALNLSWFMLCLGGISLFEKGAWAFAGALLLIAGLAILGYTAYTEYLKKEISISGKLPMLTAAVALIGLAALEALFRRWELAIIFMFAAAFVWYVQRNLPQTAPKKAGRKG